MTRPNHSLCRFLSRAIALAAFTTLAGSTPAWSQSNARPRGVTDTIDMTGPRFGVTMLNQRSIDTLLERKNISVQPMVSQFGWQFERRLYTNGDGITMLTEWIPLISGLDQGVALPSLNWLTGLRSASGNEFGIGPNITPAGTALAIAGGVTFRSGVVNIPVNVAVVPSAAGVRVSVLSGFNLRGRR